MSKDHHYSQHRTYLPGSPAPSPSRGSMQESPCSPQWQWFSPPPFFQCRSAYRRACAGCGRHCGSVPDTVLHMRMRFPLRPGHQCQHISLLDSGRGRFSRGGSILSRRRSLLLHLYRLFAAVRLRTVRFGFQRGWGSSGTVTTSAGSARTLSVGTVSSTTGSAAISGKHSSVTGCSVASSGTMEVPVLPASRQVLLFSFSAYYFPP